MALLAVPLLSACATRSTVSPPASAPLALDGVPFWPQTRYQCGPAALASVLNDSGVSVTPAQLEALVYLPGRRGSLQPELLAAPRGFGRIAYTLPPGARALQESLADATPVLVLLNRGWAWFPVWHYAVVTGIAGGKVRMHSGRERDLRLRWSRFARQWDRAGNWAMVVRRPGELPAALDRRALVEALAGLETEFPQLAAPAYAAALERWPGNPVLLFGHGTTLHRLGRHGEAVGRFRELLAQRPDSVPVRNNLALAYQGAGRPDRARELLESILGDLPADSPWRAAVEDSLHSLRQPPPP